MTYSKKNDSCLIEISESIYLYEKKASSGLFKNVINKICLGIIYLIYMYKEDLALNDLQWMMCHKTKSKQTKLYISNTYVWRGFGIKWPRKVDMP